MNNLKQRHGLPNIPQHPGDHDTSKLWQEEREEEIKFYNILHLKIYQWEYKGESNIHRREQGGGRYFLLNA